MRIVLCCTLYRLLHDCTKTIQTNRAFYYIPLRSLLLSSDIKFALSSCHCPSVCCLDDKELLARNSERIPKNTKSFWCLNITVIFTYRGLSTLIITEGVIKISAPHSPVTIKAAPSFSDSSYIISFEEQRKTSHVKNKVE